VQKISLSPVLDQSLSATLNKTINNGSTNVSHWPLPTAKINVSDLLWHHYTVARIRRPVQLHYVTCPRTSRCRKIWVSKNVSWRWSEDSNRPSPINVHKLPQCMGNIASSIKEQERLVKNPHSNSSHHTQSSTDACSIKSQINAILEHTAALDNLSLTTRQWSPVLVQIFEQHLTSPRSQIKPVSFSFRCK